MPALAVSAGDLLHQKNGQQHLFTRHLLTGIGSVCQHLQCLSSNLLVLRDSLFFALDLGEQGQFLNRRIGIPFDVCFQCLPGTDSQTRRSRLGTLGRTRAVTPLDIEQRFANGLIAGK